MLHFKVGDCWTLFFEEEGIVVTVTSARYIEMLNNFLRPELERRQVNMRDIWFQQDGATAHTARASMEVIRQMFPGHVISRFGDVRWPPRSPDLSICDFFLWGYLKSKVVSIFNLIGVRVFAFNVRNIRFQP